MEWIYLSPHFDDVALSCGGLVWEQASAGERVSVWTVCAGDPPGGSLSLFAQALHDRWDTGQHAPDQRRQEDIASCKQMKAAFRHFSVPDCIYRKGADDVEFLYASEEAIMSELHPEEDSLVNALSADIANEIAAGVFAAEFCNEVNLVCPLTLGGHVDHRLTRAAAERLGMRLWYYADYPYILRNTEQLVNMRRQGWSSTCFPLSPAAQRAWERAVAAHASQISTFWFNLGEMRRALQAYRRSFGGILLWRSPVEPVGAN